MLVRVKVKAKTRESRIVLLSNNKLLIQTKQPAKQGKANEEVRLLLATYFNVPLKKVRLVRGRSIPNKLFEIYTNDDD